MTRQAALRVLYVEDDRVSALLFGQAMLAEPRIELRTAEDGTEALAIVADWQPEVLVLDAHLPNMDGHELLHTLRALPGLAQVPAFMCSADSEPDDLQKARQSGFIGYWVKPLASGQARADLLAILDVPTPT
jgi:CheY-like chemotaxis protein